MRAYILSRDSASGRNCAREYVQFLPGHDSRGRHAYAGVDWGWTDKRSEALAVPEWHARRWATVYMGRNNASMVEVQHG